MDTNTIGIRFGLNVCLNNFFSTKIQVFDNVLNKCDPVGWTLAFNPDNCDNNIATEGYFLNNFWGSEDFEKVISIKIQYNFLI